MTITEFLDRLRATDGPWEPRHALSVHGPSRLPIRFTPARRAGG